MACCTRSTRSTRCRCGCTRRIPLAFASLASVAGLALPAAQAQTAAPAAPAAAPTRLAPVTVTAPEQPTASVGGWGDVPLARTPLQASIYSQAELRSLGAQRLADLTRLDPAVSDAYNSEGYIDYLTVRGYVLDNRFNYLRDGLPINAETRIPLDNKARIEVLKGTSGMQAGTSAPGGLVDYIVKRPLDAPLRSALIEWRQPGTVTGSVDLSQRFGTDHVFGLRLNAAAAHLDPQVRDSRGSRRLLALAGDWRVSPATLLEAEIETSHRSQPSQPGFSLLGDTVPSAGDPRINLNNQPWSQPVVFDATTASLRWTQRFAEGWRFVAHGMTQRLRTDDRLAFPFGCTNPAPAPDGTYYADRYCPNGNFDLYDFRSDDEHRRTDALDLALHGQLATGAVGHRFTVGVLTWRVANHFSRAANNFVGTGNVDGTLVTPADPTLTDDNTNRDEHTTEVYARDAIALTEQLTAWPAVRWSHLHRQSVRTDGSQPADYTKSFVTPSLALSYQLTPGQFVYASWGRGVESNVAPNRPRYTNPGEVFTTKSRQAEIGFKGASDAFDWNLAAFDIHRPRTQDFGACDDPNTCTTRLDGTDRHRGIEADGGWRQGPWALRGGVQWLRVRVEGSSDPAIDGQRPTNVPERTLKAQAGYDVASVPGLNLLGALVYESRRQALPDNSLSIPGTTRVDSALRYQTTVAGASTIWRLGIDNLFDRRAWRESPYQFSHAYLYPIAPRTFRASLQVDL